MPIKPDKCTLSTRNGVPVYYEVYGSGEPILLITGMASVLGSGLIDQSQKMTVAARAMAEKKTVGQRS